MATWNIDTADTFVLDAVHTLRIQTISGDVNVVATDGPPTLEVSRLHGRPLRVRHEDGDLTIDYEQTGWSWDVLSWLNPGERPHADISISVPRDCQVRLNALKGAVVVSGLHGQVRINLVSGGITLAGLTGSVKAQTVSGSVDAQRVGGDLTARTTSGDLTVVDGSGGDTRLQTISGAVTFDSEVTPDSDIALSTVSGDIAVRVTEDADTRVRLRTANGRIASAFPELHPQRLKASSFLDGTLGKGAGRLQAQTVSGHIALLHRPADQDAAAEDKPFPEQDTGTGAASATEPAADDTGEKP